MISWPLRAALRIAGRTATVPIDRCVHYGAFRYGRGEEHPYETYARLSIRGEPERARAWLVEFLQHYRPRHFGAALGVAQSRERALWHYPWAPAAPANNGWFSDPNDPPDIVTFFSDKGILWFRIEQEFFWLERAIYSIRRTGYQPKQFSRIVARKLVAADGAEAFLILDGNHRLSALAALGHDTVELSYLPRSTIRETDAARWPQVRCGQFSMADGCSVLRAYFSGNTRWRNSDVPAPLIGRPGVG